MEWLRLEGRQVTQVLGGDSVDANNLLFPLMLFVSPRDALGKFLQAFTHLRLISAALDLDERLSNKKHP